EGPHLLLAPARPADLGGVGALARGRHRAAVDQQHVGVGVEVELGLHPRADLARHVLVPDRRRLDDVAVAIEHRERLRSTWGPRHGPRPPRRSSRPGGAVALLGIAIYCGHIGALPSNKTWLAGRRLDGEGIERAGDHRVVAYGRRQVDEAFEPEARLQRRELRVADAVLAQQRV